ncbi:GATA type zinc finger protein asd-4 [Pleurostoma richardsiae]|uniref:GATA type zinc finger protein asd-4 n=1 Tax=Pleurostoma richardsiae TaxID=41990 RepID=A0AA38VY81_9PEZI|nr:GATA type zinc finger protein asd-4 [Pleurostoma richardsiae]
MEDGNGPGPQLLPPPATLEPISRPSSTSTQASLSQLPGISSIATGNASADSPQTRPTTLPVPIFPASSPAATTAGPAGHMPTCQNCSTSTTPLWRRDEMGAVLCNACGLFLKLHGRPRPISLKTDVIKSRNRVKTMRPDMAMKKKQSLPATTDPNATDAQAQAAAALGARRASQKSANGHVDGSHSPVSRTATPNMYNAHLPLYHGVEDPQLQAQSLPGFAVSAPSPGRAPSPLNGERLDVPQTHEQILAANSSLKTRVSELEVINDFIRGRLEQLETYQATQREGAEPSQAEAQLRAQLEATTKSETELRAQLEDSHRRENNLKRRLDELEVELKETKDSLEAYESGRAKKLRVADMVKDEAETATPESSS